MHKLLTGSKSFLNWFHSGQSSTACQLCLCAPGKRNVNSIPLVRLGNLQETSSGYRSYLKCSVSFHLVQPFGNSVPIILHCKKYFHGRAMHRMEQIVNRDCVIL